ncbi:serine protease gd-like isoform X1 [Colletes gigas]|uniref:serine protease gd-like isoform X1 n=2 Tax=Colletes gigas TaxID=935657 RepID=UPI001C9A4A45|nr:serine protease gd-like isoform X1 [Colletes gigas]XP_043251937.1 serine protease gd-like isoform X1 [Colletes gigas]XP_043251938.1 serine protease gd-like isoform X1 [Colletes gigas]
MRNLETSVVGNGRKKIKSRMVGVIVKVALLVHFLQLIVEAADRTVCVPNYFRYMKDDETDIFNGRIEIPSPPKGVALHLSIKLSIAVVLPTKYVGRLELAQSKEQSVKAIQQGRSLKYNIHFPLRRPIPTVTALWFNNELLCSGPRASGQIVTFIMLNHTLYPPGVLVVLSNEENAISTYSKLDNAFRQPVEPVSTPPPIVQPPPTQPTTIQPVTSNPKLNSINEGCGRPFANSRINHMVVSGGRTSPGQWPWLVAIFIVRHNFDFQCAGSLVTNTHIITAAHCFQLGNTSVHVGALSISLGRYELRKWNEEGSVNRHVAEYRLHPDYRPRVNAQSRTNSDSDLAVLILRERVEYSATIKPICLWTASTDLDVVVGRSGVVVGWGRDEFGNSYVQEPRMNVSPIVSQEVCLWSNAEFASITSNRTFCAGLRNGSGPCNGDSGSGFVMYDSITDRYYLRGVVSLSLLNRANMSCDLSQYVVYTDVAQYMDWIEAQLST